MVETLSTQVLEIYATICKDKTETCFLYLHIKHHEKSEIRETLVSDTRL